VYSAVQCTLSVSEAVIRSRSQSRFLLFRGRVEPEPNFSTHWAGTVLSGKVCSLYLIGAGAGFLLGKPEPSFFPLEPEPDKIDGSASLMRRVLYKWIGWSYFSIWTDIFKKWCSAGYSNMTKIIFKVVSNYLEPFQKYKHEIYHLFPLCMRTQYVADELNVVMPQ